eukprot:COSAG05_NODE_502_length_9214_cov_3.816676_2_plen_71_part_00
MLQLALYGTLCYSCTVPVLRKFWVRYCTRTIDSVQIYYHIVARSSSTATGRVNTEVRCVEVRSLVRPVLE